MENITISMTAKSGDCARALKCVEAITAHLNSLNTIPGQRIGWIEASGWTKPLVNMVKLVRVTSQTFNLVSVGFLSLRSVI
jgi:hypothetical protein